MTIGLRERMELKATTALQDILDAHIFTTGNTVVPIRAVRGEIITALFRQFHTELGGSNGELYRRRSSRQSWIRPDARSD